MNKTKIVVIVAALLIVFLASLSKIEWFRNTYFFNRFLSSSLNTTKKGSMAEKQNVVYQESVITEVVEKSLPSVVTIGVLSTNQDSIIETNPFGRFRISPNEDDNAGLETNQNIGSGFIISEDGLIITNKHVVFDSTAKYRVLTDDKQEYDVEKIYRDPLNDLAILKINSDKLTPLPLGDSSKLKLGQLAIAIGTPLGEFQNTVTVGVISGLGRGITTGSPFEGFVEKLDNVIQTDAAISPGNSGGPLLNSKGQAIAVNTAIADGGQNIGFAIPINVVKNLINTFEGRGSTFERPYIGVKYQMVDKRTAILNDVVEGAYVESVIKDSPASKAGIREDDIITMIDGTKLTGAGDEVLAKTILNKKIGDKVTVTIWRNGQVVSYDMRLEGTNE